MSDSITANQKIALFGTSADPPTAGHQTILKWLSFHYDLVIVWASNNPFKTHQTSLENRSQMLYLIIQEIKPFKNNIILSPQVSDRRTLITVQKARAIWGDAQFTFVIGADLVSQIVTWYRAEELLKQIKLLIIPRPDYSIELTDLTNLENLGGEYTIATLNAPRISSSRYRLRGDTTVVTPAVQNYIQQQQLYTNQAKTEPN